MKHSIFINAQHSVPLFLEPTPVLEPHFKKWFSISLLYFLGSNVSKNPIWCIVALLIVHGHLEQRRATKTGQNVCLQVFLDPGPWATVLFTF
jgi:hypothetical protein